MIFNFFKKKINNSNSWENQFRIALGAYWGLSAEDSKNLNEFNGKCTFDENKTIPVKIRFPKNEKVYAVFHNLNLIKYVRDGRVSGAGITFRQKIIKGVYLRAGTGRVSIQKSYQPVDTGSLYITSIGIFFDGDKQNIKLSWDKIVKESITASQIELEKQNGEPLIFSGDINPKAAAVLKILPELDFIKN
jgi:hypothetical protein